MAKTSESKAQTAAKPVARAETKAKPETAVEKPVVSDVSTARFLLWQIILTVLSFITRFYRIDQPGKVVFDEVHFGKFASYYLQGTYYFDVHPPMAKILIAMVGKLVGYDGSFLFEEIGMDYDTVGAPYVAYRGWCALQGALIVPMLFEILKDNGFSLASCILGASLVLFDTAFVTQTRLILLDATLVFTVAASICSYAKFAKAKHYSFSWFSWLLLTGVSLGCVMSTKYVGLFTVLMIGYAVLVDLYNLLDIRSGLSISQFIRHFAARAYFLIGVPTVIYLFWFWFHFALLPSSGPGNAHMSASFQESLAANPEVLNAMQINYFDTVTIQSKVGGLVLHSHLHNYPVQYPDGRISTGGQQVTAYTPESLDDPNNEWQILPDDPNIQFDPSVEMPIVGNDNVIRLRHVATDTFLVTHDVASPSIVTNEEFTCVDREKALGDKYSDSRFRLHLPADGNQAIRTGITKFYLEHINTPVAMWMSEKKLPDWGFGQIEVNGNKNRDDRCYWFFGDITSVEDKDSRRVTEEEATKPKSFFSKYLELQAAMFRSNNNLKSTHPYQSNPIEWPFLVGGISFWSSADKEERSQIYLIGNFIGYYFELLSIFSFILIVIVDQVTQLRQVPLLTSYSRKMLYGPLLWFFVGYLFHYLPFFLMGRQLFFHHYMPAYMIAALLSAGMFDLILGQIDEPGTQRPTRGTSIALMVITSLLVACFIKFMPLAYGLPLSVEEVQSLQYNKILLHFNK